MSAVRIRGGRSSQTTRPRMAKCKCQPSTDSKGVVHCCDSKNSKGGSKCECAKAGRSCNYTWCVYRLHRCLCYTPLSVSPASHYCRTSLPLLQNQSPTTAELIASCHSQSCPSGCLGDSGFPRTCRNPTQQPQDKPAPKRFKAFTGSGNSLGGAPANSTALSETPVQNASSDRAVPASQQREAVNDEPAHALKEDEPISNPVTHSTEPSAQGSEEPISNPVTHSNEPPAQGSEWICVACTYVNTNVHAPVCEVCQTERNS